MMGFSRSALAKMTVLTLFPPRCFEPAPSIMMAPYLPAKAAAAAACKSVYMSAMSSAPVWAAAICEKDVWNCATRRLSCEKTFEAALRGTPSETSAAVCTRRRYRARSRASPPEMDAPPAAALSPAATAPCDAASAPPAAIDVAPSFSNDCACDCRLWSQAISAFSCFVRRRSPLSLRLSLGFEWRAMLTRSPRRAVSTSPSKIQRTVE